MLGGKGWEGLGWTGLLTNARGRGEGGKSWAARTGLGCEDGTGVFRLLSFFPE